MKTIQTPKTRIAAAVLSATALLSTLLLGITSHANADAYAIPSAPTSVTAYAAGKGIVVKWAAVTANPPVTEYIVAGGPGSCPIVVPAGAHQVATLPVLPGETSVQPSVQAVNDLGISTLSKSANSFTGANLAKVTKNGSLKSVQLLELSDFHGAIESTSSNIGAATLAASFAADRTANPATFTVASGDNIGAAPPISAFFNEISTIKALNLMGLDASTFGNHEHDKDLTHVQSVIAASDFQWVVSNYSTLAPLKSGDKFVKPFTIINRGGVKVGIVGSNTVETPMVTKPGNLTFTDAAGISQTIKIADAVAGLNQQVAAAKAAGADIVVALVHDGFVQNDGATPTGPLTYIANNVKGAAVIFGGHTHLAYSNILPNKSYKPAGTLIGQVVNAGTSYNRVQVCFDSASKKIVGSSLEVVKKADVSKLTPDATTAALVADYKSKLGAQVDGKIGQVAAIFPNNTWNGSTAKIQRMGETALGDYIADAMRVRYGTDFAITNGGGIRDSLPASGYAAGNPAYKRAKIFTSPDTANPGPYDITYGDALAVLPFGNFAVTTSITGKGIWAAVANGISGYPTEGRFPQISGFKFSFDLSKPLGSQVTSVTRLDGTAIPADDKVYTVTTNDFMLYGGDGYTMFTPSKGQIRDLLVDVLADTFKADSATGKTTNVPALDGRITKVG